jgi:hypothetical protein
MVVRSATVSSSQRLCRGVSITTIPANTFPAFQTAVSLAEYEAQPYPGIENTIQVTEDHFKAVIELSRDFKEYLDELHLKSEDGRAAARLERLDSFQGV